MDYKRQYLCIRLLKLALVENRFKTIFIQAPTQAFFDRYRALVDDLRRLALSITEQVY